MWPITVVLVLSTVSFIYLCRPQVSCQVFFFKYSSNWISIFILSKNWLPGRIFHRTKTTTIVLIWCLKHVKDFILTFSIIGKEFQKFRKRIFEFVYHDTFFFSFKGMCWWGWWESDKLSRIQICLFPSVSHTDNQLFHEWWKNMLDYQKNCF